VQYGVISWCHVYTVLQTLILITVIGFIRDHKYLCHVFVYYKNQTSNAILQLKTFNDMQCMNHLCGRATYLLLRAGNRGAALYELPTLLSSVVVFPAKSAFIKVNLDLCAHAQLVDSAETKSKVVPKKKNARCGSIIYD